MEEIISDFELESILSSLEESNLEEVGVKPKWKAQVRKNSNYCLNEAMDRPHPWKKSTFKLPLKPLQSKTAFNQLNINKHLQLGR